MYFNQFHMLSCLIVGVVTVASSFVVVDAAAAETSRELIEAVRVDDLEETGAC